MSLMANSWSSLPQLFFAQADRWESRPLVYGKTNNHWRPLTWRQVARRSLAIANGLIHLGLNSGERAAIWMKSSPEWMLCDLGTLSAGLINVPIHDGASDQEVVYLLRDSGTRVVFVEDLERADRVKSLRSLLPLLEWVITLCNVNIYTLSQDLRQRPRDHLDLIKSSFLLRQLSEEESSRSPDDLELAQSSEQELSLLSLKAVEELDLNLAPSLERIANLAPDDVMTLQYTSGTTGEPKGVMLTHRNILTNCEDALDAVPVSPDDVLLSFLPLSHSFERVAGYYMPTLFGGATLYFSEGLGRLIRNLNEVSPTIMTGVPRIYEKIYARFRGARGPQGLVRKWMTRLALSLDRPPAQPNSTSLLNLSRPQQQLSRLLFSEFRERLGGRLRLMVSGGAPLDEEVARFFYAAGLLILEGYGLSETGPVLTVNRPHSFRFGSVGKPLASVTLRCSYDGEILAKGPNVTQGYFNKPEETLKLFTEDGWLQTGDVGCFDSDGFLHITDRKKDIFKTASGKMVAPQFIERLFNSSPLIEQTYVIGDQRPYCVALIVPSETEVNAWANELGHPLRGGVRAEWVLDPRVITLLEREVEMLNARLSRHEKIKRFHLCGQSFARSDLITASLKLKRDAAHASYQREIEALYT